LDRQTLHLKRALKAITVSLDSASKLLSEKLIGGRQYSVLQQRLFQVRDGIITLMGEYRGEWRRRFGSEGFRG
jgi:topoisomerase IA-like protein